MRIPTVEQVHHASSRTELQRHIKFDSLEGAAILQIQTNVARKLSYIIPT